MLLLDKGTNNKNQQIPKHPIPLQGTDVTKELIIAEYNQLQAGVLKRIDIRYQMIQFGLTALGVFLTIGFTAKNALLILAYPALALMLSITYVINAYESHRMKQYIEEHIEPRVPNTEKEEPFGWQHYRTSHKMEHIKIVGMPLGTLGNIGAKLTFMISSLIAVGAGILAMQLYGGANDFLGAACALTAIESVVLFSDAIVYAWKHRKNAPDIQEDQASLNMNEKVALHS